MKLTDKDLKFIYCSGKLRKIIRKCIKISEKEFNNENLLIETTPVIASILGDTFVELNEKLGLVLEILKHEQEVFKEIRSKMSKDVEKIIKGNPKLADLEMFDYSDFVRGYKYFCDYKKTNDKVVSGEFMYYIYTSCGFDLELIEKLAAIEGMIIDKDGFDEKMQAEKKSFTDKHRVEELVLKLDCQLYNPTDDPKYNYKFDGVRQLYEVEPVSSKIISIVDQKGIVSNTNVATSPTVKLVVEKSPFYCESGGQESDKGYISKNGKKFQVKSLNSVGNCVLHEVETVQDECLNVGDLVQLHVDQERRTALTRNHSASHLVNSAIRKITNLPIYQKSSLVTDENLKIELSCLGPKLCQTDYEKLEHLVRTVIKEQPLERQIRTLNSQDLQSEVDVLMVPGEVYPDDGIRLVTFGDFSKELCCGTHVFNTKELMDFAFLSIRSTGRNSYVFVGTTGQAAIEAHKVGSQLLDELQKSISIDNCDELEVIRREISGKLHSTLPIDFLKKTECLQRLEKIKLRVKLLRGNLLNDTLDKEMQFVRNENASNSFIIHLLTCSDIMPQDSLHKATQHVTDKPILIISLANNKIQARCCVPSQFVSGTFNAESWLKQVAQVYRGQVLSSKNEDPKEFSNMKTKNVKPENLEGFYQEAITAASEYAKNMK